MSRAVTARNEAPGQQSGAGRTASIREGRRGRTAHGLDRLVERNAVDAVAGHGELGRCWGGTQCTSSASLSVSRRAGSGAGEDVPQTALTAPSELRSMHGIWTSPSIGSHVRPVERRAGSAQISDRASKGGRRAGPTTYRASARSAKVVVDAHRQRGSGEQQVGQTAGDVPRSRPPGVWPEVSRPGRR